MNSTLTLTFLFKISKNLLSGKMKYFKENPPHLYTYPTRGREGYEILREGYVSKLWGEQVNSCNAHNQYLTYYLRPVKDKRNSIYGTGRERKEQMGHNKILNRNIMKEIQYRYFGGSKKSKHQIRREIEVLINKEILEEYDIESLFVKIYKAESIRRTQILYACIKLLIKVSFMGKGNNAEEKAALSFYNRMVRKHNDSLFTPYNNEELPKVK